MVSRVGRHLQAWPACHVVTRVGRHLQAWPARQVTSRVGRHLKAWPGRQVTSRVGRHLKDWRLFTPLTTSSVDVDAFPFRGRHGGVTAWVEDDCGSTEVLACLVGCGSGVIDTGILG
jgi:hypothetical protein